MKQVLLVLIVALLLISCSKTTKVMISDDNEDQVAHFTPDPAIMGNAEIFFIPNTIQGSSIWVINGPGAHIGIDIRDNNNSAFIYYADSYISSGGNTAQTGTQIPWNRWMKVRMVVYKSGLSGIVISIIDALGMDFFNSLQGYMIEQVYETQLFLTSDGRRIMKAVKATR